MGIIKSASIPPKLPALVHVILLLVRLLSHVRSEASQSKYETQSRIRPLYLDKPDGNITLPTKLG